MIGETMWRPALESGEGLVNSREGMEAVKAECFLCQALIVLRLE